MKVTKDKNYKAPTAVSFPLTLMKILDNEALSDIVSWLPHGRGFTIHDKERFQSEVLPSYFFKKLIKYESFTRRMNRWRFILQRYGEMKTSSYFHPLFIRGDLQSCYLMQPYPQKDSRKRAAVHHHNNKKIDNQKKRLMTRTHNEQVTTPGVPGGHNSSFHVKTIPSGSMTTVNPHGFVFLPKAPPSLHSASDYIYDPFFLTPTNIRTPRSLSNCDPLSGNPFMMGSESRNNLPSSFGTNSSQEQLDLHHYLQMKQNPNYASDYNRSLMNVYAEHQARLAQELEHSRLAYMNAYKKEFLFQTGLPGAPPPSSF